MVTFVFAIKCRSTFLILFSWDTLFKYNIFLVKNELSYNSKP